MAKQWTNESIRMLVSDYNSGSDTGELAVKFNCTKAIIRYQLKKQGIMLRRYALNKVYKSKAIVTKDVWESKIGTPEFDYFIGILASDGCIVNTCIALEVKDLELLQNYNNFLGNVCNINYRISKINGNIYYNIKYKNKEIVEFLENYGIVPRKSNTLILPYINWNILLGLFDGDGSIVKDKRCVSFCWQITSGSINCILQIKSFLINEGINSHIQEYNTTNGNWFTLYVTTGKDIYTIYCNLYKNSPYFLNRKKEKFGPLVKKFTKCNSVNSINGMEYQKIEPSLENEEGAETRNGEPKF